MVLYAHLGCKDALYATVTMLVACTRRARSVPLRKQENCSLARPDLKGRINDRSVIQRSLVKQLLGRHLSSATFHEFLFEFHASLTGKVEFQRAKEITSRAKVYLAKKLESWRGYPDLYLRHFL